MYLPGRVELLSRGTIRIPIALRRLGRKLQRDWCRSHHGGTRGCGTELRFTTIDRWGSKQNRARRTGLRPLDGAVLPVKPLLVHRAPSPSFHLISINLNSKTRKTLMMFGVD